jgi:hypothetical protein
MDGLNGLGKTVVRDTVDLEVGCPDPSGGTQMQTVKQDIKIEKPLTVAFQVDYTRSRGHLLSRWGVLAGFAVVLLGLTAVVLRCQDDVKG